MTPVEQANEQLASVSNLFFGVALAVFLLALVVGAVAAHLSRRARGHGDDPTETHTAPAEAFTAWGPAR